MNEVGLQRITETEAHDVRAHHAEPFREGNEPNVRWGWHCLTCDTEEYVPTLDAAEVGAEAHMAPAAVAPFQVVADGVVVSPVEGFQDREDAEAWAAAWNRCYPPADGFPEFTVEAVS